MIVKTVLIIEDDSAIRELLTALFTARGFGTSEAGDGDAGIERARTGAPDLIVLDMSLPGMTGWEVLPLLRSHPNTRKTPVIALTAYDTPESRDDAHNAGCDRFVAKLIDPDRLMEAVEELVGTAG